MRCYTAVKNRHLFSQLISCLCLTAVPAALGGRGRALVGSRISAANLPQGRWRTPRNLICPLTPLLSPAPALGVCAAPATRCAVR